MNNLLKTTTCSILALGISMVLSASDPGLPESGLIEKRTLLATISRILPAKKIARIIANYMDKEYNEGRPTKIQAESNRAFRKNKNASAERWGHDGALSYDLLGLDDNKLIKYILNQQKDSKNINIMDVGCADGTWGKNALKISSREAEGRDIRVNIFSLTGGKECNNHVYHKGNVTLYQFNRIKIENIDEELAKKNFNLRNNVHLIVSRWTLRHLVDPFGTLKRMYGLLSPSHGFLVSNGFLFAYGDLSKVEKFPLDNNLNFLTHSNAVPLFSPYMVGHDAGEFLLARTNKKKLRLPLEYTGTTRKIYGDGSYQCASDTVTVFKMNPCITREYQKEQLYFFPSRDKLGYLTHHYCDNSNEKSKKLYDCLLKSGLFYE